MAWTTGILLALMLIASSCGTGEVDEGPRLSVLLIIIDTLRADHTGYHGYERDTTPTLDSLAGAGTAWTETQSLSSWTLPSVASILTGMTPREHGAGFLRGETYGLAPSLPTLQAILHSEGWTTCGIFNVVFLNEDFGFHRAFDHFDCRGVTDSRGTRRADETVDAFIEWFDGAGVDSPFLAVIHFYDPHIPYDPPPPYDTLFTGAYPGDLVSGPLQMDTMRAVNGGERELSELGLRTMTDLYDGEIAFTDAQLARLFGHLRSSGADGSTLILVTSDHGEEFMEHSGLEHGRTLYQEVLHVPLIIAGPGVITGEIRKDPCALVDVLPTVLSRLGIDTPPGLPGIDLLTAPGAGERDLPSSSLLWSSIPQASLRREDSKLIWYIEMGEGELYDLSVDPLEQTPMGIVDSSMIEAVEYYWSTPAAADPPGVSLGEAETNQLRDLGYIR